MLAMLSLRLSLSQGGQHRIDTGGVVVSIKAESCGSSLDHF